MKKVFIWSFLVGLILGAAVVVWGFISFKGNAVIEEKEFYVSRNTTYQELVDSLKPTIKHHLAFDLYAERLTLKDSYKKGHYVVKPGMNVIEIVRMFKLGLQTPVGVTMNNIWVDSGNFTGCIEFRFSSDPPFVQSHYSGDELQ